MKASTCPFKFISFLFFKYKIFCAEKLLLLTLSSILILPVAVRIFFVLSNSNSSASILIPLVTFIVPLFLPIILLPPSKISISVTSKLI